MASFLQSNAVFSGEAWIPGTLYDTGQYPGLVCQSASPEKVWGEIFTIENPEYVLEILDGYEGIFGKDTDEYRRSLLPVFQGEAVLHCWVYEWARGYQGMPVIPDGRYESYFAQKESHIRFAKSGEGV